MEIGSLIPKILLLMVQSFFKDQFTADQHNFEFPLVQKLIPNMVTMEQNNAIIEVPHETEIKAVVFYMNADGAAGLDGFNRHFYKHCWEIIKDDFIATIQGFSRV